MQGPIKLKIERPTGNLARKSKFSTHLNIRRKKSSSLWETIHKKKKFQTTVLGHYTIPFEEMFLRKLSDFLPWRTMCINNHGHSSRMKSYLSPSSQGPYLTSWIGWGEISSFLETTLISVSQGLIYFIFTKVYFFPFKPWGFFFNVGLRLEFYLGKTTEQRSHPISHPISFFFLRTSKF